MQRDRLIHMLRDMLLARRFEERAAKAYTEGEFSGFLHLYPGEEAVAVGVLHAAEPSDYVVSTYREHVHALVRGVPADKVMAELFGRRDGICRGMGGSMHLFDKERRFMGGYAIVGETFPIAIGIAYGIRLRRLDEAVICFFGDGAANQGMFHESLNMAALWDLPVLFVCENNRYQIGTEIHRHSAQSDIYKRACAYGMPAEQIDGMDVVAVHESARRMLQQVLGGAGPQLLELTTYRFRGHSMADAGDYRPRAEVEEEKASGPLVRIRAELEKPHPFFERLGAQAPSTDSGVDRETLDGLEKEVEAVVEQAVEFASNSPQPTLDDAWDGLVCQSPRRDPDPRGTLMSDEELHYWQALNRALDEAMAADDSVFVLGEDVGVYGGSYRVTEGLHAKYGEWRVRDTPISENSFTGLGVGAAITGLRPVVEIMTVNFSLLALDAIINMAAKITFMSGGQFAMPLVIRMPGGVARQLAAPPMRLAGLDMPTPFNAALESASIPQCEDIVAAARKLCTLGEIPS